MESEAEKALLLLLASFPDLVQKAAQEYKPNEIARFALNLAKQFASYYHGAKILDEEQPKLSKARLSLISGIHQVLSNALAILGIELPNRM